MEESEKSTEPTSVYMQYDLLSNDNNNNQRGSSSDQANFLSSEFLKKYIQYAKSQEEPRLGKAAAAYLCELWVNLRNEEETDGKAKVSYKSYDIIDISIYYKINFLHCSDITLNTTCFRFTLSPCNSSCKGASW